MRTMQLLKRQFDVQRFSYSRTHFLINRYMVHCFTECFNTPWHPIKINDIQKPKIVQKYFSEILFTGLYYVSVITKNRKKSVRAKYSQTRGVRKVDSIRISCFNFQCWSGGLISDRLVLINNGNEGDVNIALSEFNQVITTRRAHTPLSDCSLLESSSAPASLPWFLWKSWKFLLILYH